MVRVTDERGRYWGRAFYSDKSQIAIRILTRENVPTDRAFFANRLRSAAAYRERVVQDSDTSRLVYSEADLLPSVIVDRYGDYFSIQTLSQGSEQQKALDRRAAGRTVFAQGYSGAQRSQGAFAGRPGAERQRAVWRSALRNPGARKTE